jgi:hypothetical protein
MTADEVRAVGDGRLQESSATPSGKCHSFVDTTYNSGPAAGMVLILSRESGYRVIGIRVPIYGQTTRGVGFGNEKEAARKAYQGEVATEFFSQRGREMLVKDNKSENYIGFSIDQDDRTIVGIAIGEREFASGFEICVG